MKVNSIAMKKPLTLEAMGNRLYKLAEGNTIIVNTTDGIITYKVRKGFVTNFRSGGLLVDRFVDQIGDSLQQVCWLTHDIGYTPCSKTNNEHPICKKVADELLEAMLVYSGMPAWKAKIVKLSVALFGYDAYNDDDALTTANSKLFQVEWTNEIR